MNIGFAQAMSVPGRSQRGAVPIVTDDTQLHNSTVVLHLFPAGTAELIAEEHHSWRLPFAAMSLAVSVQDSKMLQI